MTHLIIRLRIVSVALCRLSHSNASSIRRVVSKNAFTCPPCRRYWPRRTLFPNSTSSVTSDLYCNRLQSIRGSNQKYPYCGNVLQNPNPYQILSLAGSPILRSRRLHHKADSRLRRCPPSTYHKHRKNIAIIFVCSHVTYSRRHFTRISSKPVANLSTLRQRKSA